MDLGTEVTNEAEQRYPYQILQHVASDVSRLSILLTYIWFVLFFSDVFFLEYIWGQKLLNFEMFIFAWQNLRMS